MDHRKRFHLIQVRLLLQVCPSLLFLKSIFNLHLGTTNPASEPTPSAGLNNEENKNVILLGTVDIQLCLQAGKHSIHSQASTELEIYTITAGQDSLFENGLTTKTKEPGGLSV